MRKQIPLHEEYPPGNMISTYGVLALQGQFAMELLQHVDVLPV